MTYYPVWLAERNKSANPDAHFYIPTNPALLQSTRGRAAVEQHLPEELRPILRDQYFQTLGKGAVVKRFPWTDGLRYQGHHVYEVGAMEHELPFKPQTIRHLMVFNVFGEKVARAIGERPQAKRRAMLREIGDNLNHYFETLESGGEMVVGEHTMRPPEAKIALHNLHERFAISRRLATLHNGGAEEAIEKLRSWDSKFELLKKWEDGTDFHVSIERRIVDGARHEADVLVITRK